MRQICKMALVLVASLFAGSCSGDEESPTGPQSNPLNLSGIWQFAATASGEATAMCTNSTADGDCTLHVTCTMGPSVAGWAEGARLERLDPNCDWSTVRNDTTFRTGGTSHGWSPYIRDISVTGSSVTFNLNSASNPFEGSVTSTTMQGTLTIAEGNYVTTLLHTTPPLVLRGNWTAVKQ